MPARRFQIVLPLLLLALGWATVAEAKRKRRPRRRPRPPVTATKTSEAARPPTPAAPPRPWAKGVAQAEQDRATAIFAEGNSFFEKRQYREALDRYTRALTHWDHPAINFNTTVSLVNLGRSLEAHATLERALAFGEAPLGEALYTQALTYRTLLEAQLAHLTLRCELPGATVGVDGDPQLTCPGEHAAWVEARAHQIVVRKEGYATLILDRTLTGGESATETLTLIPLSEAVRTVRRFPRYLPWTVLGTGLALGASGFGLERRSRAIGRSYDDQIQKSCPGGCERSAVPPAVSDLRGRADREHLLSFIAYAAGGVVATAGLTLLVLNLPRQVPLAEGEVPTTETQLLLSPGGATLVLRFP